jgi:flagellar L-ring protein precursor FlgH
LVTALCGPGQAFAADLYDSKSYAALTADRRALRVGDLVTIVVMEQSDASNTTDTNSSKSTSLSAGASTLSGRQKGANLNWSGDIQGSGSVQRAGRMAAQLTVTVREQRANGDLLVQGEQEIDVHGEKTHIRLSGWLRRADISEANTALSSRLADAHIDYAGAGDVTERARPGVLARVLSWLGL